MPENSTQEEKTVKKPIKKRNWVFVLYPESAPADWLEKLRLTGCQIAISPLHDKDVNPDGTPKKPHWHVIIIYGAPTTYNNVKSLCDSLNCPIPQSLEQVKGYYRYLTHKDNPEKYQYDENEIQTLNGFDILEYVELSKGEVIQIKLKLQKLIREKDFTEYCQLLDFLADENLMNEYDVATNQTLMLNAYLKSRKYYTKEKGYSLVKPDELAKQIMNELEH